MDDGKHSSFVHAVRNGRKTQLGGRNDSKSCNCIIRTCLCPCNYSPDVDCFWKNLLSILCELTPIQLAYWAGRHNTQRDFVSWCSLTQGADLFLQVAVLIGSWGCSSSVPSSMFMNIPFYHLLPQLQEALLSECTPRYWREAMIR